MKTIKLFPKVKCLLSSALMLLSFLPFSAAYAAVIDVLVLYIPEATDTRNGRDIEARAVSYIEYANQAFTNSGVNSEYRLVGLEEIDVNYLYVTGQNLSSLANNTQVQRLRQQYGADMVSLLNLRQNVSGGFVCGIAYVGSGSSTSGTFYRGTSRSAYSLVGVDCGISTFAHELGHNHGLGHSYQQNSTGGVWDWARGHGENGLFATIMAYPQSYGTRNQVQRYSNPEINTCEGRPCGVDISRANGADASRNLRLLGGQVADWSPSVDPATTPTPTQTPTPTPQPTQTVTPTPQPSATPTSTPTPTAPPVACPSNLPDDNLLRNGDLNSNSDWEDLFGVGTLSRTQETIGDCFENRLVSSNRQRYYAGAYQSIEGGLEAGVEYRLQGEFALSNASRDELRVALRINNAGQTSYQYLDRQSITSSGYTSYDTRFSVDTTTNDVGVIFYGPGAGVDFILDKLALTAEQSDNPGNQILIESQFELDAQGWGAQFNTQLVYSRTAFEGSYSLLSRYRAYNYSGPALDVTGYLQSGNVYTVDTQVRVSGGAATENVSTWLYYIDDNGGHWQKLGEIVAGDRTWASLYADFTINVVGSISLARIHVLGPSAGANLRVDNFTLSE